MKKASIVLLVIFTFSCKGIPEPITYGDYFVTNNTMDHLIIQAQETWTNNFVPLLNNKIDPGNKTHIYTFVEGSGGHVKPSNAFSGFSVYANSVATENLIYTGVLNEDWIYEGISNEGHSIYNLTIEQLMK